MDQSSLTGPHGVTLRLQTVVKRERNIDITAAMLAGKKGMEGVLALYKPEEVVVSYPLALAHREEISFTDKSELLQKARISPAVPGVASGGVFDRDHYKYILRKGDGWKPWKLTRIQSGREEQSFHTSTAARSWVRCIGGIISRSNLSVEPLGHTLVVTFTTSPSDVILLGQALSLGGHQVIVTQVDARGVYTAIGEIAHCAKVDKAPGAHVSIPGGETIKHQVTHTTSLAATAALSPALAADTITRLRKELDAMTSRFEDEKRATTRLRAERDRLRKGISQLLFDSAP